MKIYPTSLIRCKRRIDKKAFAILIQDKILNPRNLLLFDNLFYQRNPVFKKNIIPLLNNELRKIHNTINLHRKERIKRSILLQRNSQRENRRLYFIRDLQSNLHSSKNRQQEWRHLNCQINKWKSRSLHTKHWNRICSCLLNLEDKVGISCNILVRKNHRFVTTRRTGLYCQSQLFGKFNFWTYFNNYCHSCKIFKLVFILASPV